MTLPPQKGEHNLPASQALQLVELVKRWHVTGEELLSEFGLSEAELEEPHARLSVATMGAITERARELTGEPGIGFYLGLQKRASMYGFLGFATMSAATLGEAIELAVQYTPVVTTAIGFRLKVEGSVASLVIETKEDVGPAHDVALTSLIVGMWQIGNALTGCRLTGSVDITLPEPPYFARFAHLVPTVRFNQAVDQIVFDASNLDLPLVTPDRAALRLAREQCERELMALGFDGAIVERVRHQMQKPDGFRSLHEVASLLHLSPRTLKRRLAAQGVSYSELLDKERYERSLLLLHSSEATLEEIAERLGYSTVPNFVRAFRRWSGTTPAAYRRERKT